MKNKILVTISALILIITASAIGVSAQGQGASVFSIEENTNEDAPGYIFEINDDAELPEESENITSLGNNIYLAESVDDIKELYDEDDLEYIETNGTATLLDVPNDELYYSYQSSYMNLVNAEGFWDYNIDGSGATVAIIDSGLITGHPDINYNNIITGYDYLTDTTDTTDVYGHGTIVTGIIAGVRNNSIGIAGLLNNVNIVPLKITNTKDNVPMDLVVRAIQDAASDYNADVINLSLGTNQHYEALESSVKYAESLDVIVVSAVGNAGNSSIQYPAGYASTIGVGAVNSSGVVTYYSQHNTSVFATAPGNLIGSTFLMNPKVYGTGDGTSFSAPFVTAMAAAAKSKWNRTLTPEEFRSILKLSVNDAGDEGYDIYYGHGIIDFEKLAYNIAYYDDMIGHWSYDDVVTASRMGIVYGTDNRIFSADTSMTRAMFVTILGRYYEYATNSSIAEESDTFQDTAKNSWYSRYIKWATDSGIVTGYDGIKFGPDDTITREQAVAILYRFSIAYSDVKTPDINKTLFTFYTDWRKVSSWASDAMAWAVNESIIVGESNETTLAPSAQLTRAQASTIIIRYCNLNIIYN